MFYLTVYFKSFIYWCRIGDCLFIKPTVLCTKATMASWQGSCPLHLSAVETWKPCALPKTGHPHSRLSNPPTAEKIHSTNNIICILVVSDAGAILIMMTSSNGNMFRVTDHLCGEFTGDRRPVTRSFDGFFDIRLNKRLSKQWWGWLFETPSRP